MDDVIIAVMKRIVIATAMALLCAVSVFAQTAEEIIARMDAVMDRNKDKGIVMTVDIGIPLLGTMSSRTWAKDDNIRLEAEIAGTKVITWSDSESEWIYSTKDNKVTITKLKISDKSRTSESEDSAEMLTGITEGYDVSIERRPLTPGISSAGSRSQTRTKMTPRTWTSSSARPTTILYPFRPNCPARR